MICVICETELEEEVRADGPMLEPYDNKGNYGLARRRTGYSICPKCRIVYRGV